MELQNFEKKNLEIRENFKVILGGAPVSREWVEECDADGYADSAVDAVKLVTELISK